MGNFFNREHLPKLNQNQKNNLNRSAAPSEIEGHIKILPIKISPGLDGFSLEFREELMPLLLKFPHKIDKKEHCSINFLWLQLPWYTDRFNEEEELQTNFPYEHRCKNNKIIAHSKDHPPWSSRLHPKMQGWFNIWKSVNIIHHINKLKDNNHMIFSLDAEKEFDKI